MLCFYVCGRECLYTFIIYFLDVNIGKSLFNDRERKKRKRVYIIGKSYTAQQLQPYLSTVMSVTNVFTISKGETVTVLERHPATVIDYQELWAQKIVKVGLYDPVAKRFNMERGITKIIPEENFDRRMFYDEIDTIIYYGKGFDDLMKLDLTNVTTLHVEHCILDVELLSLLYKMPSLQFLLIKNFWLNTSVCLYYIGERLPHLKTLALHGVTVRRSDVLNFLDSNVIRQLKGLSIRNAWFFDERDCITILEKCSSLISLDTDLSSGLTAEVVYTILSHTQNHLDIFTLHMFRLSHAHAIEEVLKSYLIKTDPRSIQHRMKIITVAEDETEVCNVPVVRSMLDFDQQFKDLNYKLKMYKMLYLENAANRNKLNQ